LPSLYLPPAAQTVGALAIFAVFTVYLTWPLLPHLGSSAYMVRTSPHGGDMAGSIAQLREFVEHRQNPFLPMCSRSPSAQRPRTESS
jgi:hypothetical protein